MMFRMMEDIARQRIREQEKAIEHARLIASIRWDEKAERPPRAAWSLAIARRLARLRRLVRVAEAS